MYPKVREGVVAAAQLHDGVAAVASIPARGTASRNELLPPERHAAVAPVPGLDSNFGLINEHRSESQSKSLVPKTRLCDAAHVWRGHSCPRRPAPLDKLQGKPAAGCP